MGEALTVITLIVVRAGIGVIYLIVGKRLKGAERDGRNLRSRRKVHDRRGRI